MPYKHNESRRHKIEKARYKVTNWPEYNKALRQRGDITIWFTEEALAAWHPAKTPSRRPLSLLKPSMDDSTFWSTTQALLTAPMVRPARPASTPCDTFS